MRPSLRSISIVTCICMPLVFMLPERALCGEEPERDGFTLELGCGFGFWQVLPYEGGYIIEVLPDHISYSIGGFLSNSFSLLFRVSSMFVVTGAEVKGRKIPIAHTFVGANFQYWINDRYFIGGGPAAAIEGPGEKNGFAVNFRIGYAFACWENHSLMVSLELFSRFLEDYATIGEVVAFGWQWH